MVLFLFPLSVQAQVYSEEEMSALRSSLLNEIVSQPDEHGRYIDYYDADSIIFVIENGIKHTGTGQAVNVQYYFGDNYILSDYALSLAENYFYMCFINITTPTAETLGDNILRTLSYDEAVAYADTHPEIVSNYWGIFQQFIGSSDPQPYALTQAQYDWLPEDAAYQVLVHHKMNLSTGGDPGTTMMFLYEVYPELATISEPPTTSVPTTSPEELEETISTLVNEYPSFTFSEGKYDIQKIFLLQPNEAGNQGNNDYMLGIEYQYSHTGSASVENDQVTWLNKVKVLQRDNPLEQAAYQFGDQDVLQPSVISSQPVEGVIYYTLKTLDKDMIIDGGEQTYTIDVKTLRKYPRQSAGYLADDNLNAMIFDFNKVYAISPMELNMRHFDLGTIETFSPEALGHYNLLVEKTGSTNWYIYEMPVHYELNEDRTVVASKLLNGDQLKEIATLSTGTNWDGMTWNDVSYRRMVDDSVVAQPSTPDEQSGAYVTVLVGNFGEQQISGTATPFSTVEVTNNNSNVIVESDAQGNWTTQVDGLQVHEWVFVTATTPDGEVVHAKSKSGGGGVFTR
ncbi:hypothetical protein ACTQ45_12635 [Fundicoccus sp. Sow4_D5]